VLALIGETLEINNDPETSQSRNEVISKLKEIRVNIQEKTERYLEVIDDAINKIS